MGFTYFVGAKDTAEVKTMFRKLALELHPDKGGSTDDFVAMKAEYDKIIKSGFIVYPIKGTPSPYDTVNEFFSNSRRGYNQSYNDNWERFRKKQEEANRAAKEFAAKQARMRKEAADKKEEARRRVDPNYGVIKDVFNQTIREGKSLHWMLLEVWKLEDLDLNHFVYIKKLINDYPNSRYEFSDLQVANAYRGYVESQKFA